MRLLPIAAFLTAVVVLGCSSEPSLALAKDAIRGRIDNGDESRVELVDFEKTDGQAGEVFGVKVYEMSFTAAARFVDDAYYTTGGSIMQPQVDINTKPMTEAPESCAQNLLACFSQAPLEARKGQLLRLAGTVTFQKKESGWNVAGVTLSLPRGAEVE